MQVLLVVDRTASGAEIWAMLWTADEGDPRLLESKQFRGEAALKVWLAGITTRYGRRNIRVNWNAPLMGDARLTALLGEMVEKPPPDRPEGS
jgi:hypothetical protein